MYSTGLSDIHASSNVLVSFIENTAENGGAIFAVECNITFEEYTVVRFINSTALQDGGGLYLILINVPL